MKILFVSSGNSKLGISPIVKNQGDSLERVGLEIEYFLIKGRGGVGYLKNIPRLRGKIKSNKYDIVHAHYSLSGIIAAFSGAQPLVVSLMGSDVKQKKFFKYMIYFFYKLFWIRCIVKSDENKKSLGLKNLDVIPNGVNLDRFKPIDRQTALNYLRWPSKTYILFPGNISWPEKNFALAVDAVKILKEKNSDIDIKTISKVPNSDMPLYYNACSLVLLTSLWEGSPNAVKEAMACNIPVVSSDVGDVRWLLDTVDGCYISSYQADDVAQKIEMALDFDEKKRVTNGRQRIKQLGLDSESIALKIYEIYKSISRK